MQFTFFNYFLRIFTEIDFCSVNDILLHQFQLILVKVFFSSLKQCFTLVNLLLWAEFGLFTLLRRDHLSTLLFCSSKFHRRYEINSTLKNVFLRRKLWQHWGEHFVRTRRKKFRRHEENFYDLKKVWQHRPPGSVELSTY